MTNNPVPYSNTRATLALAKASFISIIRSPSAVVFSLAFPLVFILVFGFIGNGGIKVQLGVERGCDTSNFIFQSLKKVSLIKFVNGQDSLLMSKNLTRGNLDGVINIQKNFSGKPPLILTIRYTKASLQNGTILKSVITDILYYAGKKNQEPSDQPVLVNESTAEGRAYKTIDFILPGQLGFSLLSSGVFGTAFVFISLRLTLVIKRFFATPVKRYSIVLAEALSRLLFSLIGAVIILLIGHFAFGFTLIHGYVTVLNMLAICTIGILVFMGFGFIISGIAKNESMVPPLANIVTLPQFLLAGTFFPIDSFPTWLQPVCRALPLTYMNDALRKIAFEGASLIDVSFQILILLAWGVGTYAVAVKVFKWE